jgi:hypothetical protein
MMGLESEQAVFDRFRRRRRIERAHLSEDLPLKPAVAMTAAADA